MKLDEAIRDPVFQLNLLVWMAKEQPEEGFRVRPLFSQHRFQLHYIEWPFPFPTEIRAEIVAAAESLSLEFNLEPEPELIIQRPADGQAIYFEAKAQGFSPKSSNSRQARVAPISNQNRTLQAGIENGDRRDALSYIVRPDESVRRLQGKRPSPWLKFRRRLGRSRGRVAGPGGRPGSSVRRLLAAPATGLSTGGAYVR